MKANKLRAKAWGKGASIPSAAPPRPLRPEAEMDVSLLEDSLAKTPWERMQANDDASRFADSLRDAMQKRYAKSERTYVETHTFNRKSPCFKRAASARIGQLPYGYPQRP